MTHGALLAGLQTSGDRIRPDPRGGQWPRKGKVASGELRLSSRFDVGYLRGAVKRKQHKSLFVGPWNDSSHSILTSRLRPLLQTGGTHYSHVGRRAVERINGTAQVDQSRDQNIC